VNCYPFIEADRAGRRNVARACALLKVSPRRLLLPPARPVPARPGGAGLTQQVQAVREGSKGRRGRRGRTPGCAAGPPAWPQAGGPADAPGRPAGPGAETGKVPSTRG
jgi:hypothetical protein